MKKIFAIFLAILCLSCAVLFSACDNCNHIVGDKIIYKGQDKTVRVGYACIKCGEVPNPEQIIEVDHVANTANDVTSFQESAEGDCTILLKAGEHLIVYALARSNAKTRIIAEEGAVVETLRLAMDTKDITIENFEFQDIDNQSTGSTLGIHLGDGDAKFYTNITVKNCTFLDGAFINGAWTKGVADGWIVEGNLFDHTDFVSSNRSAIQIEEIDGDTVFRNNVFINIPYAAIRLGAVGVIEKGYTKANGNMLFENNEFKDLGQHAIRITSYYELNCEVKGNVFDCVKTVRITSASTTDILNINVGVNTWRSVPTTIENAPTYDFREQETI